MNVLILSLVNVEPRSSAAGRRMLQLIQYFVDAGLEVTYATTAGPSAFAADLADLGVKKAHVKVNDPSFDVFVAQLKPTMVVFDRFMAEEQFGWRVAKFCPNALRLLDSEDLHCLRYAREKAVREGYPFEPAQLVSDTALREVASVYRCDLTLVISAFEMELLQTVFNVPTALLLFVPFLEKPIEDIEKQGLPSFDSRRDMVSIGNFQHAPNLDAVKQLREHIWPLIRQKLPDVRLHVLGAYPTQQVLVWNSPSTGFMVHGRVEDAMKVIRESRAMLAPLRFGAGLKGKLIDAMRCGTPFVTTAIGAEAMYVTHSVEGADEFADAAVALYRNVHLWQLRQAEGFTVISNHFNHSLHTSQLLQRISELQESMIKHRQENFIGQMLMHHTARSTYFMAKWIEAKNGVKPL